MKIFILPVAILLTTFALAQTAPSDSLFNTHQVVTVELTFADAGFWNVLTANYTADLGNTLTADVSITDNTGTHVYPSVEVDLKGNSTYGHPGNKKSFKIDFNDNISGQKYHGMTKMHLNNCFKDPTFMREKIFFDFCREQGVLAPRVSYANVYMNGTFWGFYDLVEPVDKNFLDRWVDDNNGNLFKAGDNFGGTGGAADMMYYGTDQNSYTERYELKTNETQNDWSDLIALLNLLNNSSTTDLVVQYPQQWEWNPMLRSLALDNIFSNLDSYINSARNYYIYHDSTTFKWNWIKWDANEAFGSYSGMGVGNLLNLAPNYIATNRPHLSRIFTDQSMYANYEEQYCTALQNFTNAHLDAKIDAVQALIAPHVAADVNKQYTTAQFNTNVTSNITTGGGPGGGTIYGLKSFIGSRAGYLSGALDCSNLGVQGVKGTSLNVYPNPTTGFVHVESTSPLKGTDLSVLDMLGRKVDPVFTGRGIDLTGFEVGVYFLKLRQNDMEQTFRLVKQ